MKNIEVFREINGFESKNVLKAASFKTKFPVLGLGDVYMGAPLAVTIDPVKWLKSANNINAGRGYRFRRIVFVYFRHGKSGWISTDRSNPAKT
jgi:hypothetical protein